MLRSAFVKKLRKIGDVPVPKGHLRRNKGTTAYFFAPEKQEELQTLLREYLGEPTPAYAYEHGTLRYVVLSEKGYVLRSVLYFPPTNPTRPEDHQEPFVTVAICCWGDR